MELSIVWVVYIHTCGYPHPQAPPIPLRRKLIYGMCLVGSEHTPSVSVETIFIFWLAASWIITWRSSISCVNVTVMLWWRWSHLALLLEIKHWWNHTCAKPYQARIARLTLAKHTLVRSYPLLCAHMTCRNTSCTVGDFTSHLGLPNFHLLFIHEIETTNSSQHCMYAYWKACLVGLLPVESCDRDSVTSLYSGSIWCAIAWLMWVLLSNTFYNTQKWTARLRRLTVWGVTQHLLCCHTDWCGFCCLIHYKTHPSWQHLAVKD